MSRLLIVSNRLPWTVRKDGQGWSSERSAGGLATALGPIMERTRGLWIGWAGDGPEAPDGGHRALLRAWEADHRLVAVDLPRGVAQKFYLGYANRTLWPLFHGFPSRFDFEPEGWDAYVEANRRFRDAVLERAEPGDRVWVHDYHLMLLPQLLREAAPDLAVGFFLHIPFPPSDVFRVLPRREELLRGLLGADQVAFHTHGYLQQFRASLLRVLGVSSRMDRVDADGRFVRLEALPIGIVPDEFAGPLERDPEVAAQLRDLRSRFGHRRILLAVDRLDYTKGIPERLRAFRHLLDRAPALRGAVVLVQVAVPSRGRIDRYRELAREVNELVGEINGSFGRPDWTPIVYLRRGLPRPELVALYAAADVGWVTPLRDGMNLVAKEYVACHPRGDGALVLSEFAGAAAEMGEAILVNPYDEERTSQAVERALAMPPHERGERMAALRRRVLRNDAFDWSERFVAGLRQAVAGRVQASAEGPAPLPIPEVLAAFRAARRPLVLLDYDGTLVPLCAHPREAAPPAELLAALTRLGANERLRIAVISGRSRQQLQPWLGGVPGLTLAAEHGAALRVSGTGTWELLRPTLPTDWKARVQPVLEHFVDRTPGSFVEEKDYSLVWHYRMADPDSGEWLANELVATLEDLLAETELRAVLGHKTVEVRLAWANKGAVLERLEDGRAFDFRLAAGDDRTDEDLFEALPADAWTVHVGNGPSRARYREATPAAVCRLLGEMVRAMPA